jgi:hypothetical protein
MRRASDNPRVNYVVQNVGHSKDVTGIQPRDYTKGNIGHFKLANHCLRAVTIGVEENYKK